MDVKHDNKTLYEIVTSFLLAGRQRTFHQSVMQQTKFFLSGRNVNTLSYCLFLLSFIFELAPQKERKVGFSASILLPLSYQGSYIECAKHVCKYNGHFQTEAVFFFCIPTEMHLSKKYCFFCLFFSFYYTLSGSQR